MAADERNVAVMFADVSGSTRLYEQLGDAQALAAIGECLALVASTAEGHGGRLVKTIGDEAMVVFSGAAAAVSAAGEIQQRMADLTRVRSLRVAFRIGINCGSALEVAGDVFGDSVNVAARMVGLAKSGQVIVSGQTAAELTPELRARLREVDFLTVKGKERDVAILELVWQDSGDLTTLAPRPKVHIARLELRHGARMIELGPGTLTLTLGRDAQNDIVIADRLGSRLHARIERRRDKFVLVDQSSNGTFVTVEGEGEIALRREEFMLRRRGHISFGHSYAQDPTEVLHFDYVEGDAPQQSRS
ncbi:MAG: adenylate/guanylate cyclase domain-containing protein [Casimicrobiaceae bacterium]